MVVAKLLIPETETPETLAAVPREDESARSKNLISAIVSGAMDGLKMAAGISAVIIAILGLWPWSIKRSAPVVHGWE